MNSSQILDGLYAERERRQAEAEAEEMSMSLSAFVRGAWPVLKPEEPYRHNWHIDAICEHLEAVSRGETRRLQIWVPRASMKSLNVSVFWPAWEWTQRPGLKFWTASYELGLAGRLAGRSLFVMQSPWYQARWGDRFELTKAGERFFQNDRGGTRLATAPGSTALGEHGHRIIIDDAINAKEADALSKVVLEQTNEWYDATVTGSSADPKTTAQVIIMQRLHESDLAAHVLEIEHWDVLCLPERFDPVHPFAWRGERVLPGVKSRLAGTPMAEGDFREEGELLWLEHRGEVESMAMFRSLGTYRASGQMQQQPSSKEGDMLKRAWWEFYDPELLERGGLPRFHMVVLTVDTPLKDKQASDNVAIQTWGVRAADRYLLELKLGRMRKSQAKRTIKEMYSWARRKWRGVPIYVLIENAGYGVELIVELKREIVGVVKLTPGAEGDKILRAESASPALEFGNCFLPGFKLADGSGPDEARTPADICAFVHNCAMFPNAAYDDDVDAWSQCMNWCTARAVKGGRGSSALRRLRRRGNLATR